LTEFNSIHEARICLSYITRINKRQIYDKEHSHSELLPLVVAFRHSERERLKSTLIPLWLLLTFCLKFNNLLQSCDSFIYVGLHFIGSPTSKMGKDFIRQ
jgi:hypothetical protein